MCLSAWRVEDDMLMTVDVSRCCVDVIMFDGCIVLKSDKLMCRCVGMLMSNLEK